MLVIPAIDLLNGQAVRLHQGRYEDAKVYDADPPSRASGWKGLVPHLHVVDLEGAKSGHAVQRETIAKIVAAFGDGVQVGGGIRSLEAADSYIELGVSRIVLGTAAIKDPALVETLAQKYPHRVVVAIDAKDGFVATDGWTVASTTTAVDLAKRLSRLPIAAILYTDISRDGTQTGANVEMTAKLAASVSIPIIASGGVGSLDHLRGLARENIHAVIVGRALYEKSFTLEEAISAAK